MTASVTTAGGAGARAVAPASVECTLCGAALDKLDLYCVRCGAIVGELREAPLGADEARVVRRARSLLISIAVSAGALGAVLHFASSSRLGRALDAEPGSTRFAVAGAELTFFILAVTMAVLAYWTRRRPVSALVTASCVYLTLAATYWVKSPPEKPAQLFVPGVILFGLISGVVSAMRARRAAREGAPPCQAHPRWNAAFCHACGVEIPAGQRSAEDASRSAHSATGHPELNALLLVAFAFLFMVASYLVSPLVPATVPAPVVLLGFMALDASIILPLANLPLLNHALAFERIDGRAVLLTLISAAFLLLAIDPYFAALRRAHVPIIEGLPSFQAAGWSLEASLLVLSLAPALLEEVVFRGFMYGRLRRLMPVGEALLVQAALFSVVHFAPLSFPSHLLMGLIFGLLRERTGSLYPGMLVHAAWNAWCTLQEPLAQSM